MTERVYRTTSGEILSTESVTTDATVADAGAASQSSNIPKWVMDDFERFVARKRRDQKLQSEATQRRLREKLAKLDTLIDAISQRASEKAQARLRARFGLSDEPQVFTSALAEKLWNTGDK